MKKVSDLDHPIRVYSIKPDDFRKIPRNDLGFVLSSSLCCNDLALVAMHIIFEQQQGKGLTPPEKAFINSRQLMILRHVVSKIFEYHQLVQGYFGSLKESDAELFVKLKQEYSEIGKLVASAKWAEKLRNKVSFHFDAEFALASFDKLEGDQSLRFFAGEFQGATVFEFADDVLMTPLIAEIGEGDLSRGLKVAMQFAASVGGKISRFHAAVMIEILSAKKIAGSVELDVVREHRCGELDGPKIPLLVGRRSIETRKGKT